MENLKKIKVTGNLVELDGDEMTRIIWHEIKSQLILPFLDIPIIYFDLGLENRNITDDEVTLKAAEAIKEFKVGVKCATITPNQSQVIQFNLKREFKSPNGQLRNFLDGTIFREPVICKNIPFLFKNWKKKIIIGRHGFGDQYIAKDLKINEQAKVELLITEVNGEQKKVQVCEMRQGGGVALAMFNSKESIEIFARACMQVALDSKMPLYLTTKDTILKQYDGMFRDVFKVIYETEFQSSFQKNDITYEHRLIDDMVAYMVKSEGGFVWACKNYDGDVQSDCIAQGFGSLGMMSSMLVGLNGVYESEAAHGTVAKHYKLHLKGEETSTNSVASIFAWTKGLKKRGEIDENQQLIQFSDKLEETVIETIENGTFTKDIALSIHPEYTLKYRFIINCNRVANIPRKLYVNTFEFITAVKDNFVPKFKQLK